MFNNFNLVGNSLSAQNALHKNLLAIGNVLTKLSTGYQINRAADNPAGLIVSEKLRSVLAALDAATQSAQRADHVISTADGALGQMSDLLNDAEGLVVANANDAGLSDAEREANQLQLDSIVQTVNRIANTTSFNGEKLFSGDVTLTVANRSATIGSISMSEMNIVDGDMEAAQDTLHALQNQVAVQRGELGAFSSHTVGPFLLSSAVAMENVSAANSAIRDTDFAMQLAELSRVSVLGRSSLQALSLMGANAQSILTLLK